ncbi:MAG: ATP-binding protein [Candidatus Dormibacteraeota bacterium]|nr:ATP-binding protein [Candidatus Dormibacteraeota bacterium]
MSRFRRHAPSYLIGVVGVALITALIGLARTRMDVPGLAVAYVVLVIWLGARSGWPVAVVTAILAFAIYEWFFVPPLGTLMISAPRDLFNLLVLLAAALVGGRLTASIAAQRAGAAAAASESGILYELATAALREQDQPVALDLLCRRAVEAGGLEAMSLVSSATGVPEVVAGAPLSAAELGHARWSWENGVNQGARLVAGTLEAVRSYPVDRGPAYVHLPAGVAVLRIPRGGLDVGRRRLLAALLGLAGLLLDRRRAAHATERAQVLEASDALKTAVLSSISHELKSPIASLRAGLTTLLMPAAGLAPEQRDMVAGLDRRASRLDRLVGDLLAMSRLEAGVPPERTPHALEELVGVVVHSLRPALAGFDLQLRLAPDLPPVEVDELQVERLVTNLLENAIEWTPAGGAITLGARATGSRVEAWVQNQGEDIPAADLDRLFDKFWTRRREGSGLGLAIARRVVEAHGGAIRAENTRSGPRFTFDLPAASLPAAIAAR